MYDQQSELVHEQDVGGFYHDEGGQTDGGGHHHPCVVVKRRVYRKTGQLSGPFLLTLISTNGETWDKNLDKFSYIDQVLVQIT